MRYQTQRKSMAVLPAHPLDQALRQIAKFLLDRDRRLTPQQRQLLHDVQRDGRSRFATVCTMADRLALLDTDAEAMAMSEALAAFTRTRRPKARAAQLTLVEAITLETTAQAQADVAEVHAALAQNDPAALARCERGLLDHQAAIENTLRAVRVRRMELLGAVS